MIALSWLLKLLGLIPQAFRLYVAVALGLAAFLLWFGAHERSVGRLGEQKAEAARLTSAETRATELAASLARSTAKAAADARQAQDQITARTRTIIERIPYEVPAAADPGLGAGWLRQYNASLGLPEDPGLARRAAAEPALPASDALRGIVENNAACESYVDAYQRIVRLYDEARAQANGFAP